jgi:5,10-methylenetetrahydromethanopterin reductase
LERFGLGITNCRPALEVLSGIKAAESMGAEIAFVAEDIYCRDAFELTALAAKATTSIRLATGVVNPYTRHPVSLAMAAATLDELSNGRATLGLGSSSPALLSQQLGIPHGDSVAVMREAAEVIRSLLRGDTVRFEGSRFCLQEAKLGLSPVQPQIPIYFAAMGPKMLRLDGMMADGVLLNVGASTSFVSWAVRHIHRGASDAGRDAAAVTVAAWLTVHVTDDHEEGLRRAREWLATMLSVPRQGELLLEHGGFDSSILPAIRQHVSGYPHAGDASAAARFVPPEVAKQMTLLGSPAEVRRRLTAYRAAGVDLPVMGLTALTALYQQ